MGPCPLFLFWDGVSPQPTGSVTSTRDQISDRLRQTAARVAANQGLELFDLQVRREAGGWMVRVILDRVPSVETVRDEAPGGIRPEELVGIEDCQRVSRELSDLLDADDSLTAGLDQEYTLEVSSPGLDRPLRGEADYRRFVGRLAKIVTREPVQGQTHFEGRLSGVENGEVLLSQGRRVHRVALGSISRARLEVEF